MDQRAEGVALMAYTQADLDRLDGMIASGTLEMTYDGKRVVYRSMEELMQARSHIARQIGAANPASAAPRFINPEFRGV